MTNLIEVCTVDGGTYYGSEQEALAARLEPGTAVRFEKNGILGVSKVRTVWFYGSPMVDLENGMTLCPNMGDVVEIVSSST